MNQNWETALRGQKFNMAKTCQMVQNSGPHDPSLRMLVIGHNSLSNNKKRSKFLSLPKKSSPPLCHLILYERQLTLGAKQYYCMLSLYLHSRLDNQYGVRIIDHTLLVVGSWTWS